VTRAGFAVAYPPEYQAVGPNLNLLAQAAKTTGGEALAQPIDAFRLSARPGVSVRDLWPLLLLWAAVLFPLDVAVRRLALPLAEVRAAVLAWLGRRRPAAVRVPASASIARLHQAKQQVSPRPAAAMPPDVAPDSTHVSPRPAAPAASGSAPPPAPAPTALSSAQRLLEAKRGRESK